MIANNHISYVGTLQDLGRPFSMLFVDKENRQLYVFVRLSDESNNRFLVTGVSASEVESYMNEDIGLVNMLVKRPYQLATIYNNIVSVGNERFKNFTPTERMKKMNMFDPDLCDDDVWLEVFLNRLNNNQPLEIA